MMTKINSKQNRIIIIDDDERLCGMLSQYLNQAGFEVKCCHLAQEGLDLLAKESFDAIILDLMLPDGDGLDVCQKIRSKKSTSGDGILNLMPPILMLTARGDAMDRVVGLEIGADDYMAKPFEPRELLARIKSILRRSKIAINNSNEMSTSASLKFGRLEIDSQAMRITINGEERSLTSYQFDILYLLATHSGKVMSREHLFDMLKGSTYDVFDRSIDVHISRIRLAIEDDPKNPKRIITLRGAGYIFAASQD